MSSPNTAVGFAVLSFAAALAAAKPARAEPPQDPKGIFTLQIENDAVSTFRGTSDQNYTSGLRLGADSHGRTQAVQYGSRSRQKPVLAPDPCPVGRHTVRIVREQAGEVGGTAIEPPAERRVVHRHQTQKDV